MDFQLLQQMINEGYVVKNKHPEAELYIYNYTQKTQYEGFWNEVTLQCRGLILDANRNIIARPFGKFFNFAELQKSEIPNTTFKVYDKLDGSLGILYFLNEIPYIASRGSFDSDQAKKANEIVKNKYQKCLHLLNKNYTYLFEIIYPENRIVVDYGDLEDLILLEIIETRTGKQLPLETIGFPVVKQFDGLNNLEEIQKLNDANKEGFVIKYENGFRLKIKFDEYVRLHRIITKCSSIEVWQYLRDKKSIDAFLDQVPDEFFDWIKATENQLKKEFERIEMDCKNYFKEFDSRKETAVYFLKHPFSKILFAMLDNKTYEKMIWEAIKPKYEKPFFYK